MPHLRCTRTLKKKNSGNQFASPIVHELFYVRMHIEYWGFYSRPEWLHIFSCRRLGRFFRKEKAPHSQSYLPVCISGGGHTTAVASRTTEYAPPIHTNTHQIQWALFLNCTARPILGRFLVLVSCATYQSGKRSHCPTHIGERFAATTAALRIAPLQLALRC